MRRSMVSLMLLALVLNSASWAAVTNLKARVGGTVMIKMDSNPTTGYSWQLARPIDGKMLRFLGSKYYADKADPQMVGVGGEERWSFRALKCGRTRVFFKYVRPWEKNVAPVDAREYLILIR